MAEVVDIAQEALSEESVGPCISCLYEDDLDGNGLCGGCAPLNRETAGALLNLLRKPHRIDVTTNEAQTSRNTEDGTDQGSTTKRAAEYDGCTRKAPTEKARVAEHEIVRRLCIDYGRGRTIVRRDSNRRVGQTSKDS